MMAQALRKMGLSFNPFEPSASGAPITAQELWLPQTWQEDLSDRLRMMDRARGARGLIVSGDYGTGKTYILRWLQRKALPDHRVEAFYFDNPGVRFYDLANTLLRQIGRKDFAKVLWELARAHVTRPYQRSLFADGYEEYLTARRRRRSREETAKLAADLGDAILAAGITDDEETAHRFAKIVTDIPTKPYFEYRDFVAGRKDSLVSEGEEVRYFSAILRTLRLGRGVRATGFLIDEFEEIALGRALTRRAAHDYLATLRRLINFVRDEDLWLVIAMTPDAAEKTQQLEPSLWDRFTAQGQYLFGIPPLRPTEARDLVAFRLDLARDGPRPDACELYPFPDQLHRVLRKRTLASPRRIVKVCFHAIAEWRNEPLPFEETYLKQVEARAYPTKEGSSRPNGP